MSKAKTHRPRHETEALERHAAAQARSEAKRRDRNAPRRDDLARAAYYVLLALYADPNCDKQVRLNLQRQTMALLQSAGFDLIEANATFVRDAAAVLPALNGWLARRWIEEGRRLGDGRGRYRPITGRPGLPPSAAD